MVQLTTNRKMRVQKGEALVRQNLTVDPLQQIRRHFPTRTIAMQMLRIEKSCMHRYGPMFFHLGSAHQINYCRYGVGCSLCGYTSWYIHGVPSKPTKMTCFLIGQPMSWRHFTKRAPGCLLGSRLTSAAWHQELYQPAARQLFQGES